MEEIIKGMPDGAEAIQKNFAELVGKTQGQAATFKDFAEVAADMVKYSGAFTVAGVSIDNAPFANPWYVGQVITGTSEKTGAIVAYYFGGGMKVTAVSDGKIVGWHELATTDNAGLIDWQPNMDVKKGQLVTFKTLGTISTGLLTNPIFISLIDQNTGSTFPAADSIEGVSGKWKLMNSDAFSLTINAELGNGAKADYIRHGNLTTVHPTTAFNSQPHVGGDFGTILLAGSIDASLRPDIDSMMTFQTTNGYANNFMILFRTDGSAAIRQQSGSAGDMGSGTVLYFTMVYQSATRSLKWLSGVPTV